MKKSIVLFFAFQMMLFFNSCSSDSGDKPSPVNPPEVVKNATINSFSKNFGETGETITVFGENFSAKTDEIKINFDDVAATIISATTNQIVFILPATKNLTPKFNLTIANRNITNNVKNNYEGNIGVLPKPIASEWFTMENKYNYSDDIYRVQMIDKYKIYYTTSNHATGISVIRSLDGGISWTDWSYVGFFYYSFYATKNDEGWSDSPSWFLKAPIGGHQNGSYHSFSNIKAISNNSPLISSYVEDDMKTGTVVDIKGNVYTTNDGEVFTKVFSSSLNDSNDYYYGTLQNSYQIDNNHIWAIGFKKITDPDGFKLDRPFILFKNNAVNTWKEYLFKDELMFYGREICFVDTSTGFFLIKDGSASVDITKIYKTTTGGDTWFQVYDGENFTKFAFKDGMTGWAILDNKIYKTTNGGVAWTLDYTHDQPIRNIAYKDNAVWAISNDKIIKKYL
jgi:IPT/TIG domain